MKTCSLLLALLNIIPSSLAWIDSESRQNDTDIHMARIVISDGELMSAQSDVTFDRHPAYRNGKDILPLNGGVDSTENVTKTEGSKDVFETHHTTCQVSTEELVASAQATVTRVLKGLCTSREIESRFEEIENALANRLNELKVIMLNLDARMDDYNEALRRGKYQQMETIFKHCDNPKPATAESLSFKNIQESSKSSTTEIIDNETEPNDFGPRESEIKKFNSSISIDPNGHVPPKKVFTYYWRIPQIRQKMAEMQPVRSIRSSSFYVYLGGYRLYLRCYPRQAESNFYVHVGITKGEFDEALKWPFSLKLRVNILDQTPGTPIFEDIASRTWDPKSLCSEFNWKKPIKGDNHECVGLGFPHDLLNHRKYIYNDAIVIKLSVYLDS